MWAVVIVFLGFFLIRFAIRAKRDSDKIKSEGGLSNKYSTLIDHFLNGHPSARVLKETNSLVMVGTSGYAGSTIFYISQSGNNVMIMMKVKNNPLYGNVTMNWSFHDSIPQQDMIKSIENDIQKKFNELNSRFL